MWKILPLEIGRNEHLIRVTSKIVLLREKRPLAYALNKRKGNNNDGKVYRTFGSEREYMGALEPFKRSILFGARVCVLFIPAILVVYAFEHTLVATAVYLCVNT